MLKYEYGCVVKQNKSPIGDLFFTQKNDLIFYFAIGQKLLTKIKQRRG